MLPSIDSYRLSTSSLPANRTRWQPDPHQAVLLVHDMQNHFVQAFDRTPHSQITQTIRNIQQLHRMATDLDIPTVFTAQPPQQDPADRQLLTDFWGPGLQDPHAAHIIQELTPHPNDTVLTKWRYCAFYRSDLEDRMRNHAKTQLWITGIYSHIGCMTTALSAFMRGFQVFFIADAQADFSEENHRQALTYVSQRCGQVLLTRDIITAAKQHEEQEAIA
ncbi:MULTISPECIES: isochorismatase family protein [Rothia]|uniref:Isochorismatase-like domain-containing protein n=1 Tax=Rothia nasimurium TaxID=85336 RepID=A0A1Y1RP37_9MICC|nr:MULTISPECIES: isochorismatase family protein [Rothia]ORC15966.1 hypothetical protein A7979_04940 [Rothia nasimurium]